MAQAIKLEPSRRSQWDRWKPILSSPIASAVVGVCVTFAVLWWKGVPELNARVQNLTRDVEKANGTIRRSEGVIDEQALELESARAKLKDANVGVAELLRQLHAVGDPDKLKQILEAISTHRDAASLLAGLSELEGQFKSQADIVRNLQAAIEVLARRGIIHREHVTLLFSKEHPEVVLAQFGDKPGGPLIRCDVTTDNDAYSARVKIPVPAQFGDQYDVIIAPVSMPLVENARLQFESKNAVSTGFDAITTVWHAGAPPFGDIVFDCFVVARTPGNSAPQSEKGRS